MSVINNKMTGFTLDNAVQVFCVFVLLFVNLDQVFCSTFVNELSNSVEHHHVHCNHEHPKADQVRPKSFLFIFSKVRLVFF